MGNAAAYAEANRAFYRMTVLPLVARKRFLNELKRELKG